MFPALYYTRSYYLRRRTVPMPPRRLPRRGPEFESRALKNICTAYIYFDRGFGCNLLLSLYLYMAPRDAGFALVCGLECVRYYYYTLHTLLGFPLGSAETSMATLPRMINQSIFSHKSSYSSHFKINSRFDL